MGITAQLQTKLKSSYFDFIYAIHRDYGKNLWTRLMEKLKIAINASYTAIYIYEPSLQAYQLKSDLKEEANLLKKTLNSADDLKHVKTPKAPENHLIPLEGIPGQKSILYIAFEQKYTKETLHMIKSETENVIRIISRFVTQQTKNNHEKIIADLASLLLSFTRKEDILNEATRLLTNSYPSFSLQLILSQDMNQGLDFPVETMEYNEDGTILSGVQAFMSGEVQLEKDTNGNILCIYAPLTGNQGVYGVFKVTSKQEMHLSEMEAVFMKKVADTTGKAMEKAILYENSTDHAADLKLINDATHTLNSNLKLEEITKYVRNQIMEVCHATQVGYILYNEEENDSFTILQGSTSFFFTTRGRQFATALLVNKNNDHEAVFSSRIKEDNRFDYHSVMVIPMHHAKEIHGFVAVMHEDRDYFTFDMFKLLQALIKHSTLALANALLTEQLEKAVITDYLTNLYSRSYLEEEITKQQTGTLILFDIDDFKVVNDTYGHHIGDEVLKEAAKIIRRFTKAGAVAARWGGEELALYAPNMTINQGVQIAGHILNKVNEETNPPITLSSGVSSWNHEKNDSVIELFIRADKALYEAKNKGKNSVMKK